MDGVGILDGVAQTVLDGLRRSGPEILSLISSGSGYPVHQWQLVDRDGVVDVDRLVEL